MLIWLKINATYYCCDGKIHAIMIVRSWIATFKVAREALNYAKLKLKCENIMGFTEINLNLRESSWNPNGFSAPCGLTGQFSILPCETLPQRFG